MTVGIPKQKQIFPPELTKPRFLWDQTLPAGSWQKPEQFYIVLGQAGGGVTLTLNSLHNGGFT